MVILGGFEPALSFFNLILLMQFVFFILFSCNQIVNRDFLFFSFNSMKDAPFLEKLFIFILIVNFCGLSGSWESFSGWPSFVLMSSLIFWMTVLVRWSFISLKSMFSHFTPENLFFVSAMGLTLIEIFSNAIRPLTLGMRLCANIMGGHLILDLMGEMKVNFSFKMMFLLYEMFVCFMQSLIFCLLLISYFEESN